MNKWTNKSQCKEHERTENPWKKINIWQTCKVEEVIPCVIAIHYGVVGNMQASHVCAPGSIPGNGTFFEK